MEERNSQFAPFPKEWDNNWREVTSFYSTFPVAYDLWDDKEFDQVITGVDLPTVELQKVLHKYTGGLSCLTYDDETPLPHPTDKAPSQFWKDRAPVVHGQDGWGKSEMVFHEDLPDGHYNSVYVYANGVVQLALGGHAAQSASSLYFWPIGFLANTQGHGM
tara:strand:- start:349 stop:831 length:483 start_codon:yes stop_codon:yes gene_type:complete